jgi:hypothetical protein
MEDRYKLSDPIENSEFNTFEKMYAKVVTVLTG